MSLLADYRAVTGSPTVVLNSIVNAPINGLNDADRAELIQALVDDIVAARASQTSRLNQKEAGLALAAIKSLGRVEAGSRVIATEQNLRHFLAFASDLKDADASKQAMRCIANAILLVPAGRDTLVDIQGDEFCTRLYINESTSPEYLFLASRLLFFMCHTDGEFISRVVRQHRLPNLLAQRLESLGSAVQSETPFAKDALTDMLKVHFTAVAKYTKLVGQESNSVLGEYWDDVFEPTAAPLIKLLHTLPSTPANPIAAPLTYAIHALLNVPVTPFAHLWFPTTSEPSPRTSRSSSSGGQSPRPSIDKSSPTSGDTSPLARALNLLNRRSSPGRGSKAPRDSAMRALTLLTQLFAIHLPGTSDPDDLSVRSAARTRGIVVDELGSAIVALVTRLAADEGARSRIHTVLFPTDLDRTTPLEKKDDLLGRCIRLMTSVYYPTLKDAVGEMLFVICGSDGQALSAAIGYGNAAGFLYNKGIMAPPPDQTEDGVNPITGTRTTDAGPPLEEMTEEEKQREAERLFVLFDRMERMGMAKNPIREAYQSGKLQD